MRSSQLLALAVAGASAQFSGFESSLDMTLNPVPDDGALRGSWCNAQTNTCNTLCGDEAATNDCDYSTLEYECTCASNDSAPGLQYYEQTMPTFICNELQNRCIVANENNSTGQDDCNENIRSLCGTNDPSDVEDSADSTTTTAAPTSSATGDSDDAEDNSDDSSEEEDDDNLAPSVNAHKSAAALAAVVLAAVFLYQ